MPRFSAIFPKFRKFSRAPRAPLFWWRAPRAPRAPKTGYDKKIRVADGSVSENKQKYLNNPENPVMF